MNIQPASINNFFQTGFCSIDLEEQEIIRRLLAYGVQPTGNKTTDKMKLHELELNEVKITNKIENKFLTVSLTEQEKILEKKNETKSDFNPDVNMISMNGAKLLGEQLYLEIQMKKKKQI